MSTEQLNDQIQEILERNRRVTVDKAWETSWTRTGTIALIIYLAAVLFMWQIEVDQFLNNALIPVLGYLLSTQTLPPLKRWWLKKYHKETSKE
ncbi:MAG: hypothetical protein HY565_02940 [Candidatus Kerfeldbacteria bacterium]|nr:hypothetical protein [Candidatus Kerfeldbacteria bacterium]